MEMNNPAESTKEIKSFFTPKNIMRILSLICIVCVFCPAFIVSCSDGVVEVDVMTAVSGMSMYGDTVVDPHPIMLLCLIIPIAVLAMLFVKKIAPRKAAMITAITMSVDFVMWLIFKSKVKEFAEQNFCKVKVTGWFYLNVVAMLLIIALAFLIVINILQMDVNFLELVSGNGTREAMNKVSARVSQMTSSMNKAPSRTENNVEELICPQCGIKHEPGAKFCSNCGNALVNVPVKKEVENSAVETQVSVETAVPETQVSVETAVPETDILETIAPETVIPETTVPEETAPEVMGHLQENVKKLPKKLVLGIVGVAALLVILICLALNMSKTINLDNYVTVEATGYDGYGRVSATIDWNGIEEKYGDKISLKSKAKKEYDIFFDFVTPIDVLKDCIDVEFSEKDHLKNGDKVEYTWDIDEEITEYIDCKIKSTGGTYEVSDLEEVGTFDAFADLEVTFEGIAPNGSVTYKYTGDKMGEYDFSCSQSRNLSNGDTVTITIKNDDMEYYVNRYGMVPAKLANEYKVSGLQEYVSSYEKLSDDFISDLKSEAKDTIYAYATKSYKSSTLSDLQYVGYVFNTIKDADSYYWYYNSVSVVYAGTLSSSEGKFDATTVTFPVRFTNILCSDDSFSYNGSVSILGSSFLKNGYYTKGYLNPMKCYEDIVESDLDEYDVEAGDGFEQYAENGLGETEPEKTGETKSDVADTAVTNNVYSKSPFYGIWCYSTKELSVAQEYLEEMEGKIHGTLFVSSDWSNLNKEKWYAIAGGIYGTKAEAENDLPRIQSIYPDAYIRYSGEYVGIQRIQYTVITLDSIVEGPGYFDITPVTPQGTLRVDENTEFDSTCDMSYFDNYQKGDTVLEWYQRNYELGKAGESRQALVGVFEVSLTGNHIDKIYGIYWWD